MLERYTRERQKGQGKKGAFNLEDEGEELEGFDEGEVLGGLTHGGRSVLELPGDDFDKQGLGEVDEDESGVIGRRAVDSGHFGGFKLVENGDEENITGCKAKLDVVAAYIFASAGTTQV